MEINELKNRKIKITIEVEATLNEVNTHLENGLSIKTEEDILYNMAQHLADNLIQEHIQKIGPSEYIYFTVDKSEFTDACHDEKD